MALFSVFIKIKFHLPSFFVHIFVLAEFIGAVVLPATHIVRPPLVFANTLCKGWVRVKQAEVDGCLQVKPV